MKLSDEPRGWGQLQEMAQREKDPDVLAAIIEKMNRLLDHHERSGRAETERTVTRGAISELAVRLEVQTWQLSNSRQIGASLNSRGIAARLVLSDIP